MEKSTKIYQLILIVFTVLELIQGLAQVATAIVATEFLKEESKIRIIYAEQFEKSDPTYLVNLIFNLYHKYGSDSTSIYVDGSNRAFLNMLKIAFNESLNWEKSMVKPNANNMNVIPVNFSTEHKEMLSHLAMLVSKVVSLLSQDNLIR